MYAPYTGPVDGGQTTTTQPQGPEYTAEPATNNTNTNTTQNTGSTTSIASMFGNLDQNSIILIAGGLLLLVILIK